MSGVGDWRAEVAADPRRVVIVDDDPTGTQTVSGVRVVLRVDRAAFDDFFASPQRSLFVLSNTRALRRDDAAALVTRVADTVRAAASAAGTDATLLLRGDSTLRGHVFTETDAVDAEAPVLLAPALPEAGRHTRDGVHYLRRDGVDVPVADTEFARDPVFGYRSSRLADWVAEVSGGARRGIEVPLSRQVDAPDAVAAALRGAAAGDVVLPDAASSADIAAIAAGLVRAERAGCRVVVRCAASLAAARAGVKGKEISRVAIPPPGRLLVCCGSFTAASSQQVRALGALWERRVEIPVDAAGGVDPATVAALTAAVRAEIHANGRALLATPRARATADSSDVSETDGFMDTLVAVVAGLRADIDGVIAKGGITGARLARDALGAAAADVVGQPATGVPLWQLPPVAGSRPLPYVIVPGNVGDDGTIARLLDQITAAPSAPAAEVAP
ncbi:MAG: four-carbon acid sugar kinase family protein [Micromonosporaceae bacterium]